MNISMPKSYLEFLVILGEERGADEWKDWPPILPPLLAADASSTDPSVKTPAVSATIANFANLFSSFLFLRIQHGREGTHISKSTHK